MDGALVAAPAVAVEVVDTIGAGDSTNAGWLAGVLNGWPAGRCAALAAACGSLSTRARGGTAGQPTLDGSDRGPVIVCAAANPSVDRLFEVERLHPGRVHRPGLFAQVAGGKGLNAARAAATLGADVHVVVILAGHAGRWLEGELERAGIAVHAVWVDGESRSSLSVANRSGGGLTEFYEHGVEIGDRGLAPVRRRGGGALGLGRLDGDLRIAAARRPGRRLRHAALVLPAGAPTRVERRPADGRPGQAERRARRGR